MDENDTFKKLKRVPIKEIDTIWRENSSNWCNNFPVNPWDHFLDHYGYTRDEWMKHMNRINLPNIEYKYLEIILRKACDD